MPLDLERATMTSLRLNVIYADEVAIIYRIKAGQQF